MGSDCLTWWSNSGVYPGLPLGGQSGDINSSLHLSVRHAVLEISQSFGLNFE